MKKVLDLALASKRHISVNIHLCHCIRPSAVVQVITETEEIIVEDVPPEYIETEILRILEGVLNEKDPRTRSLH